MPEREGTELGHDSRLSTFVGGSMGQWRVDSMTTIAGDPLPRVERISLHVDRMEGVPAGARWALRGVTSNLRYTTADERSRLVAVQAPIGRPSSDRAALIPIRKSADWWEMTQDARRDVFEARSRHIEVGLGFLPAIARRLHHCRDLGESEPFDFITFFDYEARHEGAFDRMLEILRASEEWRFVDREIDVRLVR